MQIKPVLISGAGIAGTTLAYWLNQYGIEPVVIERAPAFRGGGYMIDFWGLGYELADRMGILPRLKSKGYFIEEVRYVDRSGKRIAGIGQDAIRSILGERYLSILRSDLASQIYETTAGRTEMIFGDSIRSVEQCETGVRVTFERNGPRKFDLLIGADGVHSTVRRIAFGNGSLERFLGYYAASFSVERYPKRDEAAYVCYSTPGNQIARYALRGDRTVFFLVCAADGVRAMRSRNTRDQMKFLQEAFADEGWECRDILAAADSSGDFYFDSICQVRTDRWSNGRVGLIGDAAFCPSLLAGEGASFAMAAAYLVAGELKRAGGAHRVAFSEYERIFRPFIERKQRSAERFAAWFAPRTRSGIRVRNFTTHLMSSPLLAKWMLGGMILDQVALPEYY